MSQYIASVPSDDLVPTEVRGFFERFYQVSDTPGEHEQYARFFTPNATLLMGPSRAQGTEGIVQLREKMWEKITKRSHHPIQIFTFGAQSGQYMLHGTATLGFGNGGETSIDWAARAEMASGSDGLQMSFYQVYLDSAATSKAS